MGHRQARNQTFRPSSPIGPQDLPPARQFTACQRLEEERDEGAGTDNKKADDFLEIAANETFFLKDTSNGSDSEIDTESEDENDDWKDKEPSSSMTAGRKLSWIDSGTTIKAQNKLIKILRGEALIPKQRWSLCKILATLTYHQKDGNLRLAYQQFRSFAYQSIMAESIEGGHWPDALTRKD